MWASPIHSRSAQNKKMSENKFSLSALLPLNWDIDFLLPSDSNLHHQLFCFSGPSDLNWNYTNGSGSELLSPHNCVSQLLYIHRCALYMFIYMSVYKHIYTCVLLVMFLWRTLANTVCPSSTSFFHLSHKTMFFESLLYAGHSSACLNKISMHSSSCRSLFFSD